MAVPAAGDLNRLLREREVYPYCHLSDSGLAAAAEAFRSFELRAGDRLTLLGDADWHYLSLLSGRAWVAQPGMKMVELTAEATRNRPYPVRPLSLEITVAALDDLVAVYGDSGSMDMILSWDELAKDMPRTSGGRLDGLETLRRSEAFRRLPMQFVEEACRRLHRLEVPASAEVTRQGTPAEAFYVIARGWAEQWQIGLYDDEPQKVADLHAGDSFGEDALVSGGTSDATVRFPEGGELLVLNRKDFVELISLPMIREVEPAVAKAMLDEGHVMLDVRYEEEAEESRIAGSVLLPLYRLRQDWSTLDPTRRYIAYCRSGKRSAVAALLLSQRGLSVASLHGGVLAWPHPLEEG